MKVPEPTRLKSGEWRIQLRLGGKSMVVTDWNKKECISKAALVKAEYQAGKREAARAQETTLTQAIDDYISKRSNTLSPLTIRGYRILQKNRFRAIANRDLHKIAPEEWQGIVNIEAGTCSPKTLKNAWGFVRSVVHDTTGTYPPEVKLPALPPPDKPFLDPEQIRIFVAAVKDTKYAVPSLLALCSLRISEIQALDWKDIPKNPEFIRVRGAVVLDENNQKVKKRQNKNATSTRDVPIMIPELSAALERDRKPSGPVMEYHQNSLRVALKKICAENNLPDVGIHGLRHSFASLAYHLQIPEKIAMEIGGWSDTTTMHNIYTHIAKSDISRYQTELFNFFKNGGADTAQKT